MRKTFVLTSCFGVVAFSNAFATPLQPVSAAGSSALSKQILNSLLDAEKNRRDRIREIREIPRDLCREPPGHDHDDDHDHCKQHPASP